MSIIICEQCGKKWENKNCYKATGVYTICPQCSEDK